MASSIIKNTAEYKAVAPDAVSVPSGQWTQICDITLTKGVWSLVFGGAFASNATGYRRIHLGQDTSAGRYSPTTNAVNGDQTRMNAAQYYLLDADANLKLYASQNSGSTISFYGFIRAVQLA